MSRSRVDVHVGLLTNVCPSSCDQTDHVKCDCPLSGVGLKRKRCPVTLDCDGMGSIPAIPEALNLPLFKFVALP